MVTHTQSEQDASLLDQLITKITEQFDTGQTIDLDAYLQQYPAYADQLRHIVPAIEAMQMLRQSSDAKPANPMAVADEHPPVRLLGDYRIVREIGRGGMGIVYEAEQVSLRRGSPQGLAICGHHGSASTRAVQERSASGSLSHPPEHRPRVFGGLRKGRALLRHAICGRPEPGPGDSPVANRRPEAAGKEEISDRGGRTGDDPPRAEHISADRRSHPVGK